VTFSKNVKHYVVDVEKNGMLLAEDNCKKLAINLRGCEAYICNMVYSVEGGKKLVHSITGTLANERCHYTQHLPNRVLVSCIFNEEALLTLADNFSDYGDKYIPLSDERRLGEFYETSCSESDL